MNAAIREAVRASNYKDKIEAAAQRAAATTPEEFRQIAINEEAKWRDVIKQYDLVSR